MRGVGAGGSGVFAAAGGDVGAAAGIMSGRRGTRRSGASCAPVELRLYVRDVAVRADAVRQLLFEVRFAELIEQARHRGLGGVVVTSDGQRATSLRAGRPSIGGKLRGRNMV